MNEDRHGKSDHVGGEFFKEWTGGEERPGKWISGCCMTRMSKLMVPGGRYDWDENPKRSEPRRVDNYSRDPRSR